MLFHGNGLSALTNRIEALCVWERKSLLLIRTVIRTVLRGCSLTGSGHLKGRGGEEEGEGRRREREGREREGGVIISLSSLLHCYIV